MSSNPVVLHIIRPYASVEEFLAAEAWTIDARAMILIGDDDLAADTAVLFDVAVAGEKVIRAEGKVAGRIPAAGDRPGGLRIRFKRYGASTKAFIDRAVQSQRPTEQLSVSLSPAVPSEAAPISLPPISRSSVTENELIAVETSLAPAAPPVPVASPPTLPAGAEPEPSGVHLRPLGAVNVEVDVPLNRNELLARLRDRARSVDLESFTAEPRRTG